MLRAVIRIAARSKTKKNSDIFYGHYLTQADDGYSGTNFERPAFKRLLADIEQGKINLVLTKDLSRLGRDYIQSGQYTELYFPAHGVRYIAVNDGYDSASPYTDIAPFKHVLNEMYARDASRKIKSAFAAHMRSGAFIGNFAPYGYAKDETDKHRLVVDESAAAVVREIFALAAEGLRPAEIARRLNAGGVTAPADYRLSSRPRLEGAVLAARRPWSAGGVAKLLRNPVYLGHLAQGKTSKLSFKSSLTIRHPSAEWIVVENTHPPLVSQALFDLAARRSQSRLCEKKGGFVNIFSGLAKCADCGRNMSSVGTRKQGSPANLACGAYKLRGGSACSNHFIDYNALYDIVLSTLRERLQLSEDERARLRGLKRRPAAAGPESERQRLTRRAGELDSIIARLYEDQARGSLDEQRFTRLLAVYEREGAEVARQLERMEAAEGPEDGAEPALLSRLLNLRELDSELLFLLIERIEIGQGYYERTEKGRVKRQKVTIYLRFSDGVTKAGVREYII